MSRYDVERITEALAQELLDAQGGVVATTHAVEGDKVLLFISDDRDQWLVRNKSGDSLIYNKVTESE